MVTVTIPKKDYKQLLEKAMRYEYLRTILHEDIFSPPPTKSVKNVIRAFRATKKYNRNFLKGLERGLKQSSYFHGNSSAS